jgi:hypothetical protein
MKALVFAGPTLRREEIQRLAPEVTVRGPVACGDVLSAVREGFDVIGLIDGFFDHRQPVWHKEILWALSEGRAVYGAASLGALRAAELDVYGMRGVGRIYELFRSGVLERDDEVTIAHAPANEGYRALSVALVNMRFTLRAAVRASMVSPAFAETFCAAAAALFYPQRTYETVLRLVEGNSVQSAAECSGLRRWLTSTPSREIDQKRLDALELVNSVQAAEEGQVSPGFTLARTESWFELLKRSTSVT